MRELSPGRDYCVSYLRPRFRICAQSHWISDFSRVIVGPSGSGKSTVRTSRYTPSPTLRLSSLSNTVARNSNMVWNHAQLSTSVVLALSGFLSPSEPVPVILFYRYPRIRPYKQD